MNCAVHTCYAVRVGNALENLSRRVFFSLGFSLELGYSTIDVYPHTNCVSLPTLLFSDYIFAWQSADSHGMTN